MSEMAVNDVRDWQAKTSHTFVPLKCTTDGTHFTASLRTVPLTADLSIAHIRSGAVRVERTDELARHSEHDDLLLSLQLRSSGRIHQHGRTAQLAPGSACLYETHRPYILDHHHPDQDLLVLRVPRQHLGLDSRLLSQLCGRTIDPSVPGMSAFAGYALGLVEERSPLSQTIRGDLASLSIDLLGMALRSFAAQQPVGWGTDQALLESLKAHIKAQFADPGFSVEQLAAVHHISARKLHALFSAADCTPGAHLREARLDHAAKLLTVRSATRQTVASIARNSGFRDASTFTRAFTRAYGCSPTHWVAGEESRAGEKRHLHNNEHAAKV